MESVQHGPSWLSHTRNFDDEAKLTHAAHYHKVDVWIERAVHIEKSRIFLSPELVPDADFAESEIYQDWSRRLGVFRVLGSVFDVGQGELAVLGVHRSRRESEFVEEDRQALGLMFTHLRRAMQLRHRLAGRALDGEASLSALEHSGLGVLIVSRACDVLYANSVALTVLKRGDALRAPLNKLSGITLAGTSALTALVHAAAGTAQGKALKSGGALRLRRAGALPVTLFVAPFRPSPGFFGALEPAAILLVRDPELVTARTRVLRDLFGFTATEAAVAALLAEGQSIDAVAAAQGGVSLNTARTHLKSLLVKTGTNRQAELVALVLQSGAVLSLAPR